MKKTDNSDSDTDSEESKSATTNALTDPNRTKTSVNNTRIDQETEDEENDLTRNNEDTRNDDPDEEEDGDEDDDQDDESNNSDENSEDNNEEDDVEEKGDLSGGNSQNFSLNQSQGGASEASMNVGSDRQSRLDLEGLTEQITEIDNSRFDADARHPKKPPKHLKIQKYFNPKNEPVYTLSAKAFTQFEDMIVNLIGANSTNNLNPEDPDLKKITKLAEFDKPEFTSGFVPDMKILNNQLDFSIRSQPRLSQMKVNRQDQKQLRKDAKAVSNNNNNNNNINNTKPDSQEIKHEKIITIIANSNIRPRKILRILLNRRNTSNFDQIMADICNNLKMEYGTIKKFYTLRGIEVTTPLDFFKYENIFIAVGSEKVFNKDFELDHDEAFMVFANELIKTTPNFKMTKIANKFLNKKTTSKPIVKEKPEIKPPKTPFETDPEKMPEDLLQNYTVGPIIGEGNFATVRECVDINTGIKFALKIIDLRKCKGKEYMIENELKILRRVKHPNIIKLVEEYRSEHKFYLIMELLKYGDLLDAITATSKYTERDAACMIYNLASAVAYLHSLNIAHRDIKLENILIHKHPDGGKTLKLGDFGLAVEIKDQTNQVCGSPIYVAPEILMGKSYSLEVDIWSLGVIAYILLCGFAPFRGETEEETFKSIKNDNIEFIAPFWDNVSADARDLIQRMLTRDQKKRIKASEILQHPWLLVDNTPRSVPASPSTQNARQNALADLSKPKPKTTLDEVSKNLSEFFRRSSRDPAIALVTTTALDKQAINVIRTPTLDKVDENNEDI